MQAIEIRALLQHAVADYNDPARRDRYFELYSSDAVVHSFLGPLVGRGAIRRFYQDHWAAFPDAKLSVYDVIVEGGFAACRFRIEGTHQAAYMGLPATFQKTTLDGMTMLRFSNGRCVERWSQADVMGLMRQLGAVPAQA